MFQSVIGAHELQWLITLLSVVCFGAWSSPKLFVAGAVLPASDMNTYVSDNDTVLRAGGFAVASQAVGDILVASSTTQFVRDAALAFDTTIDELKSGRFRAVDAAPASPNVTTVYSDSIVKAWAAVTNSGSPTIADDVNVASLTDNDVGDVTVTFATALPSANYAAIPAAEGGLPRGAVISTKTTAAVRVLTMATNFGTASDIDFSVVCIGG